jgi:predicted DNA-binding transcriptional regulator AlpA
MASTNDNLTVAEVLERDPVYVAMMKAIDSSPKWVSIKQAAAILGRSVRQVRRYQSEGKMPPRKKAGRALGYSRADIEAMKTR